MHLPHCEYVSSGRLPVGEARQFSLRGPGGMELRALDYGGIVTHLLVPGRDGKPVDVALGFDDLESYAENPSFLGALVGRVAGRIPGGRFSIDGRACQLALNDGPNHLHGGETGLARRLWKAEHGLRDSEPFLTLRYASPDGEEGYPGNLRIEVTYSVTSDNAFVLEECVESDAPTPVSLTQHSYFNLAGEGEPDLSGHRLSVFADRFVPCNAVMSPLGRLDPVTQANDFRQSRDLMAAVPGLFDQHGDLYRIDRASDGQPTQAATVEHPATGVRMDVITTRPFVQLYSGKHFDGTLTGKSGRPYNAFAGFCLECEGYPDAVNHPDLDDIIVRPGHPVRHRTEYRFSILP